MNPTRNEAMNESAPLSPTAGSKSYAPVTQLGQTYGTTYFLASTILASIIPIIELGIGLHYKGQCLIDQRIPIYMIVAGICGLVLVVLSLSLAFTFICFIPDSTVLTVLGGCSVCLNVVVTVVISIFLFIWFIIGCVWVFSIRDKVQFTDRLKPDYCHPVLYKSTFVLLVITIVWACIQCCASCFRSCLLNRKKN